MGARGYKRLRCVCALVRLRQKRGRMAYNDELERAIAPYAKAFALAMYAIFPDYEPDDAPLFRADFKLSITTARLPSLDRASGSAFRAAAHKE